LRKSLIIILLFLLGGNILSGQNEYGILPAVNLTIPAGGNLKLNAKSETRFLLPSEDVSSQDAGWQLVDVSLAGVRNISTNTSVAIGGLFRHTPSGNIYRAMQQIAFKSGLDKWKYSHRIRADQTFSEQRDPQFRLRYRFTLLFSLEGLEIDPHEFYFRWNTEYLFKIRENEITHESRWIPLLGYAINDDNKVEGGMDYRWDAMLVDNENNFWLSLNWYYAF
jgi:hypothetical protein